MSAFQVWSITIFIVMFGPFVVSLYLFNRRDGLPDWTKQFMFTWAASSLLAVLAATAHLVSLWLSIECTVWLAALAAIGIGGYWPMRESRNRTGPSQTASVQFAGLVWVVGGSLFMVALFFRLLMGMIF